MAQKESAPTRRWRRQQRRREWKETLRSINCLIKLSTNIHYSFVMMKKKTRAQLCVKNAFSSNNSAYYCAVTLIQLVTSCSKGTMPSLPSNYNYLYSTSAAGGRCKRRRHNSATNYYCCIVYNVTTLWILMFLMNSSLIGSTGDCRQSRIFFFIDVCRFSFQVI